jgi:Zn-dependent M28 family amino/carboxypeptidase
MLPHGRLERIAGSRLQNVVGVVPGRRPGMIVGAHYDVLAQPAGFLGANNGAAGTAVVLEIARAMASTRRPAGSPELRFVLFDGEEPAHGTPETASDFYAAGLRGSKAYVARHPRGASAMILLDYVGNKGLRLPREASSSRALWAELRAAARAVGRGSVFPDATETEIIDDHTPFLRAGTPAIDLIDWRYPGHDLSDTLDKLSRQSLDAVGESVIELILRAGRAPVSGTG